MAEHRVQVFHGGSFLTPSSWGWQCFTCGTKRDGLNTEAEAQADAAEHGVRI